MSFFYIFFGKVQRVHYTYLEVGMSILYLNKIILRKQICHIYQYLILTSDTNSLPNVKYFVLHSKPRQVCITSMCIDSRTSFSCTGALGHAPSMQLNCSIKGKETIERFHDFDKHSHVHEVLCNITSLAAIYIKLHMHDVHNITFTSFTYYTIHISWLNQLWINFRNGTHKS